MNTKAIPTGPDEVATFAWIREEGPEERRLSVAVVSTPDRQNRCHQGVISNLGRNRDSTFADRFGKAAIVAKVLVGIFNRELAHRVVERRI